MKYIVSGKIYRVDFISRNQDEFKGTHPALCIKNIYNKNMCFVIPFTTYTKDRWEKERKYGCIRVESTNSIARLDKMLILHISEIKNEWVVQNNVLKITTEEFNSLCNKIIANMTITLEKAKKEYKKGIDAAQKREYN